MSGKRKDNKGRILRSGESQRQDGKYMFRYVDGDGHRRTAYSWKLVETDRLKDGQRCTQSLREMEKQIQTDIDGYTKKYTARNISVDDLFLQFMNARQDLRESSRCCYFDIYNKHIKPKIGDASAINVKTSTLQKLYSEMVTETKVSPSTAQKAHTILYQTFQTAVRDKVIVDNPASDAFYHFKKTMNLEPQEREPLTIEQQNAFIKYVCSSKNYCRLANLFIVMLGTGMRIGEALGLRWSDCDFNEGVIYVNHTISYKRGEDGKCRYMITSTKTISGIREIPMLDDVRDALESERKYQDKFVRDEEFEVDGYSGFIFLNTCGKTYSQAFIYDSIQSIVTDYNREELLNASKENREPILLPKISAHIFRHTFCSRMCEMNINIKVIQDIMGHKNIRTTMEVYTKLQRTKKAAELQALNRTIKSA